jgi:integrase
MTADYDALPAGQKYDGIRPLKKETQLALWISLLTLCRIGELLQAEWKNVDLPPSPCISFRTSRPLRETPSGAFPTSRMMGMWT